MAMSLIDPSLMGFNPQADPSLILAQRKERPLANFLGALPQGVGMGMGLAREYQERQTDQALRDAVTTATDPQTGQINQDRLREGLYRANPERGAKIYGAMQENQAAQWALDARKQMADMDMMQKRYETAARIAAGTRNNPAAWGAMRPKVKELVGYDVPETPDDSVVEQLSAGAMDAAERKRLLLDTVRTQMQERAAQSEQENARARIGLAERELDATSAYRQQSLAQQQAERAAAAERWAATRGDTNAYRQQELTLRERQLSGYYPQKPTRQAPAGTQVGKPWIDGKTGERVQQVMNPDGTTREERIPRELWQRPDFMSQFLAAQQTEAPPAQQPPTAQGAVRETVIRNRQTGEQRAVLVMPDGSYVDKQTGQPIR